MITLSRRNLGPYRLTQFKQHEHSRGIFWAGNLTCLGSTIGHIEQRGDGGATVVRIDDAQARRAFEAFLESLQPQMEHDPAFGPLPPATTMIEWTENFALWLADEAELTRRTKRQVKRATILALVDDPPSTTRILREPFSPTVATRLRAHYGDRLAWIANEVMDSVA
jgi:hypothetical protein